MIKKLKPLLAALAVFSCMAVTTVSNPANAIPQNCHHLGGGHVFCVWIEDNTLQWDYFLLDL